MPTKRVKAQSVAQSLPKSPTGIQGLDEITFGGLPRGRPTLVCGGAGCGKTMLAAEFIIRGAIEHGEAGVLMTFEENPTELAENVRSLGFDLVKLQKQKKVIVDYVHIERSEIEETGEYDLEGLFIRLGYAIDNIGAKRVALDTIEALFTGLPNQAIVRAELRRLFRWLKERGVTAVITGEQGEQSLTRYGLEEYVADCVIFLDHRLTAQVSTRRLRVLKYRGSPHGTNEYPFLIGSKGLSVLPITSLELNHPAHQERVSTGIPKLDEMLGNRGVYRGSSVLITGAPGTGKSSICAAFASAACQRGERVLLFSYEESQNQIIRNMRSIGIDLERWNNKGILTIHAARPTFYGLEQHLVRIHELVVEYEPNIVIIDPISNLTLERHDLVLKPVLMRIIDFLKQSNITAIYSSLTDEMEFPKADSQLGISSLMDCWLLLANLQHNSERTRTLQVLKARGMAHSNQVREFQFNSKGIDLVDADKVGSQVLTGSARLAQEAKEVMLAELHEWDNARGFAELAAHRKVVDAQIAALVAESKEFASRLESAIERQTLLAEVRSNTPGNVSKKSTRRLKKVPR